MKKTKICTSCLRKIWWEGPASSCQKIVEFDANALYLYWHAHDCYLNEGKEFNEKRKKPMAELRQETEANSTYIKDLGYKLVEM